MVKKFKKPFTANELAEAIKLCCKTLNEMNKFSRNNALYSMLCKKVGKKDDYKNRLLLFKTWQRNKKNIEKIIENKNKSEVSNKKNLLELISTNIGENTDSNSVVNESCGKYEILPTSHNSASLNVISDEEKDGYVQNINISKKIQMSTNFRFTKSFAIENFNESWKVAEERRNKMKEKLIAIGITCIVIFKGFKISKKSNSLIIEYGMCKKNNCRKFRFEYCFTSSNYLNINVKYDKQEDAHDNTQYCYQLRGEERCELKTELTIFPSMVRSKHIQQANEYAVREGNLQKIRSLSVYQKARSEAKTDDDLHREDYNDLLLKSLAEPKESKYRV